MTIALAAVSASLLFTGVSSAQDERGRAAEPTRAEQRLENRLERLEAEQARLRAALERLQAGEAWDDVRPDLEKTDSRRGRRRPGDDGFAPAPREAGGPGGPGDDDVLDFLRGQDRRAFERLTMLRERDPERFRRVMAERAPQIREMLRERDEDPEAFALRQAMMAKHREVFRIVREAAINDDLRSLPTNERLRRLVAEQMKIRSQLMRREIGKMMDRIHELEAQAEADSLAPPERVDEEIGRLIERAGRRADGKRRRGAGGPDGPGGGPGGPGPDPLDVP